MGNFFHTPKPRKFSIPYRYFDPEKEAMQEREERIKSELGMAEKKEWSDRSYKSNIKGQFRRTLKSSKSIEESKRKSATRLVLLIVILGLIFYLLLKF
jgi:F0F1-type ATP synthase membrane subunit b/b'